MNEFSTLYLYREWKEDEIMDEENVSVSVSVSECSMIKYGE